MSRKQMQRRKKTNKSRKSNKSNRVIIALQKLKRMRPNHQREAIKLSNDTFIRALCSDIKKLRNKPIPPSLKARLKKQRKHLQKFVRKNTSITAKRKMLSQRGGFLPLVIAALPAIGAMIGNAISRARSRR